MKRLLSLLCILALLLSLFASTAFAAPPSRPGDDDDDGGSNTGDSNGLLQIIVPSGVSITMKNAWAGTGSNVSYSSVSTADGYKTYSYKGLATGSYSFVTSGSGYNKLTKDIYFVSGTTQTITKDPGKSKGNGWEQGSGIERTEQLISDGGLFASTPTSFPGYEYVFNTPVFTDDSIGKQQFTPHDTMLNYIHALVEDCSNAYYYNVGKSPTYGFEFPLVVFSKTDLTGKTMEEAGALIQANGKPTVFHQAQVHGNEPAAGEGSLALIYAAATGNLTDYNGGDILDSVNILVYPRINADGSYKFQRNNVYANLNMNRGYLHMRSSEVQDVVSVYNAFRPHIVMDAHEWTPDNTGEKDSYFDDLWLFCNGSTNNSSSMLDDSIVLMENVFADAGKVGIRPFFYVGNMNYDASEGTANSLAPYYYGLRGSYAFCVETRGIGVGRGCFERRVFSHYLTAESMIRYAAANAEEVVTKVAAERARIAQAGTTFSSGNKITLKHSNSTHSKAYPRPTLNLLTNTITNPNATQKPTAAYTASSTRTRPTAYIMKAGTSGLSTVLKTLDYHDIPYIQIPEGMTISVKSYSGTSKSASLSSEKSVTFEAGSYIFPMNHSEGNILAMIMEPDVFDSSSSESYSTFVQRGIVGISSIYRFEGNVEDLIGKTEPVPEYTVTFYGEENQVLATETVKEGASVSYTGVTPTKAYTEDVHYVFNGWADVEGEPAVMGAITEDTAFYAIFSEEQHTYTAATTTEATCISDGVTTYTCPCGRSYEESIPSLGHSAELQGAVAPTCSAPGYTGDKVCTTCKEVVEAGTVLPTEPHTEEILPAVEPSCLSSRLTEGKKCSVCNIVLVEQTVIQRLGHNHVYADNADGTHADTCGRCGKDFGSAAHVTEDGICSLCGAGEAAKPTVDSAVEIRHTLNLASDISINYAVAASQLAEYDSYYLECVIPVYDSAVLTGESTVRIEPELKGNYYYFTLTGITAVQMGNEIRSTLYMKKDGAPYYSNTDVYSVATYAYSQLSKADATKNLKTLCADLLIYGSSAQIFKDYRTDALVDSAMTEEQKFYCSDTDSVVFGNNNSILDDIDVPDITWVGKSLSLESKVVLKFIFDTASYAGAPEELTLRITYRDYAGVEKVVTLANPTPYGNIATRYSFDFGGLLAAELRSVVDVAIFVGETQVSSTLRYSADTYGNNKTDTLLTLCKALFAYSDSAKAFFG